MEEMFSEITSKQNFDEAFRKTQLGSPKFKFSAIAFSENRTVNLGYLRSAVIFGHYEPGEYVSFPVFEPKERVIFAPKYRDKIVQHAVNNILRDFYEPKFIYDSYACIRGKGNKKAALRIQSFQRKACINYEDPWIVKADVASFFYSIDRDILLGIVRRKIDCPETLALIELIVLGSPGDIGLPLGNLISQLLANVLMNDLDNYIKRTLGVKYYVRYADDLILIVDGKAQAKDVLGCIRAYGRDVLALTFPDKKCYIRPAKHGLETLGYKITPAIILLTSRAKSQIIKRLRNFDRLLHEGKITPPEVTASLMSWYSYARTASCQRFVKQACERTAHIRFTQNERFIILRTPK